MSIEIKNLSKKFNEVYAVKNIDFTIGANKTIGLLGPNGCGKTTSIGMMLGLIKPTTGDIIIQNKNINTFERNKLLSIMNFASPYVELPKKLSVKQNLQIYGRLYGVKDLSLRIDELAEDLNLKDFINKNEIKFVSYSNKIKPEIEKIHKKYNVKKCVRMKSSLKFCVIAAGEFDGYVAEPRASEWDIAAGHAILFHSGGSITDFHNNEILYGKKDFKNPSLILKSKNLL